MDEELISIEEILFDAMDAKPDKLMVIYVEDEHLNIMGNMTYMELLGAMELARDQVKEMLREEY